MKNVVFYTRVARRDQEGSESIRRQRERCEALARTLGLQVTATVADEAGDRTGLAALLEQANVGQVNAVLAVHIDRFGRRPLDLLHVLDTLDKAHVEVHTVTGGRINATENYARRLAATTAPVRRPGRRIVPPASRTARRAVS